MISTEAKLVIGVVIGGLILIAGGAFLFSEPEDSSQRLLEREASTISDDILLIDDAPSQGAEDATVTIVEFSDFQCPACAALYPIIKAALEQYEGNVRHVYRYFPLEQNFEHSMDAAFAVEAARKQGMFWEMHDILLKNQLEWSQVERPRFVEYAEEIGLNTEQFKTDTDNTDEFEQRIREDMRDGRQARITATPTLFINGRRYTGSISTADLFSAIDQMLDAQ